MIRYTILFIFLITSALVAQVELFVSSVSSSADYNTISDAITDLELNGLTKDVIIYIEGEFEEQLELTNYIANSDSYEIIFISVGNPDDAIITFEATSASNNFLVDIAGEKIITFQNLTFIAKGTNYSRIINSEKPKGNLTFIGNEFHGNLSSNASYNYNIAHFVADDSDENLNNITFQNNQFFGGYYALYLESYTSPKSIKLNITNNYFESSINGMSIKNFDGPTIDNNEFLNIFSRSILLETCENSFSIQSNKMSTDDNLLTTGIEINQCNAVSSGRGIIANNFIQSNSNGIIVNNSEYIDSYFNTINIENTPLSDYTFSYAFSYDLNSKNLNVINNIFNNYRGGYAIIGHSAVTNTVDYNNLFSEGFIVNWNSSDNYSDLKTFKTNTSTNANSYDEEITFVSRTDLHIQSSIIELDGMSISSISIDIDGDVRKIPPFIGADEYSIPLTGPLNGSFTVGSLGDFETIASAVNALYTFGIDGPVTFNILNGTYNQQIVLDGSITGSSETNRIIFQSYSGNPADVEFTYAATSDADNFIIYLDYVEFIEFRNFTFTVTGSDYSTILFFGDNIEGNLVFYGNVMNGIEYEFGDNVSAFHIVNTSSYTNLHNTIFENNIIHNGYSGFFLSLRRYANSSYYTNNLKLIGNIINTYNSPIKIEKAKNVELSSNNLQSAGFNPVLSISDCEEEVIINKNVIKGSGKGVLLWACTGAELNHTVIKNNIIQTEDVGLDIAGSDYVDLYFNTIKSEEPLRIRDAGYSGSLYLAKNIKIKNNILHCVPDHLSPDDFSVINWESGEILESDYNNMYIRHNFLKPYYLVIHGTNKYEYLSDWQVAEGFDLNSIEEEVKFEHSTNDLHITSDWQQRTIMPLNGIQIPSITVDIDGDARSNPPYMGADEPHILKLNLRILLEGAYNGTEMYADLQIPNDPAYDEFPYSSYTNLIPPIPVIEGNNIIDRVTVELLAETTYEVVETQSAYVLQDGTVVDLDGVNPVHFASPDGNYFVSVKHRNHLAVMSSEAIFISGSGN